MAYLKITKTSDPESTPGPIYLNHRRGSQEVFTLIDEVWGPELINPYTDVPEALEADGWADDEAFPEQTYYSPTDEFEMEVLTEEEYREETDQQDVPTHLLQ